MLQIRILKNNDLVQLPHLLGHHKNLRNLTVDGNPLKSIRRAVIDKGTDFILKYLKDKFIEGKDDIVEEWALMQEKTFDDYKQKPYGYQKEMYAPGY